MTTKQVFSITQMELSKVQAPNITLNEFNYYFNKAINQYINKVYNIYDLNQRTTDDIRVLKSTAFLDPVKSGGSSGSKYKGVQQLYGAVYEAYLPKDYLHLLNCMCIFQVNATKDCYDPGDFVAIPATRLTADSYGQVMQDVYNEPSARRPYYYIHNQNSQRNQTLLSNPIDSNGNGTDSWPGNIDSTSVFEFPIYEVKSENGTAYFRQAFNADKDKFIWKSVTPTFKKDSDGKDTTTIESVKEGAEVSTPNFSNSTVTTYNYITESDVKKSTGNRASRTVNVSLNDTTETHSAVEKPAGLRLGNSSNIRLEIRYGSDDKVFTLKEIQVDYIKVPQFIRLSYKELHSDTDTSQILEFPDYVNQEIINELVHLLMEHNNDPRLGNNIEMTKSIAQPATQQTQQAQA